MYDFYFGEKKHILKDEKAFLLSVKRILPKWLNSIPDAEFLALCDILDEAGKEKSSDTFNIVETGAGASSIAFLYYAYKYDGKLYSWEMNSAKLSQLKLVCLESISKVFEFDVNKFWTTISYNSCSPYLGLTILTEMAASINVFFHDSSHTLDVVLNELSSVLPLLCSNSYVLIDDVHYQYKSTDMAYVNLLRTKLGLSKIENPQDNHCIKFKQAVIDFFEDKELKYEVLSEVYSKNLSKLKNCSLLSSNVIPNGKDFKIDLESQMNRFVAFELLRSGCS